MAPSSVQTVEPQPGVALVPVHQLHRGGEEGWRHAGGHLGHDEGVLLRAVDGHQVPAQPRAVGPRLPPAQPSLVIGVRGAGGEELGEE